MLLLLASHNVHSAKMGSGARKIRRIDDGGMPVFISMGQRGYGSDTESSLHDTGNSARRQTTVRQRAVAKILSDRASAAHGSARASRLLGYWNERIKGHIGEGGRMLPAGYNEIPIWEHDTKFGVCSRGGRGEAVLRASGADR